MSASPPLSPKPLIATPKPTLSVFDGVMIITGITIGSGIFSFPSLVADMTGSAQWMFGAWALGAVLALIGALCYAELATTFPHAGGDYHFLTRAYGKDVSFFFAWARVLVITTGTIALLAFVFGDYMTRLQPLGEHSAAIYAAAIVLLLTTINMVGLHESARTQNLMAALLVLGLLMVAAAGFSMTPHLPRLTPAPSTVPPLFGSALLFVLFTYGGWNEAAYISAEVKGGGRSIVKVLILALTLVALVYLVFVAALWAALGFEGLRHSPAVATDAVRPLFGATGEKIMGGIVALAAISAINATLLVAARTGYALANDWPLLRFMSHWNPERRAPMAAFALIGTVTLALVLLAALHKSGIKFMVEFTAPVFWFFFMLTGIALFVLRFRYPHVMRPFKVPLFPILPMVFVGTCAFLLYRSLRFTLENQAIQIAFYVMGAGVVAWAVARLGRAR